MNQLLYSLSLLFFSSFWCFSQQTPTSTVSATSEISSPNQAEKQQRLAELEFMKTRDPETNTVPRERLWRAASELARQQAEQENLRATTNQWIPLGPLDAGGIVRAMVLVNSTTAFVGGADGGLYKCTNLNAPIPNWAPVCGGPSENLAISAIAKHPVAAKQTLYVATGDGWLNPALTPAQGNNAGNLVIRGAGIWKSTNNGITWTKLDATNNNSNYFFTQRIVVVDNGTADGIVFVATLNGLFRSIDGGANFSQVLANSFGGQTAADNPITNGVWDIEVSQNKDIYVSFGVQQQDGIFKSTYSGSTVGGGGTWVRLNKGTSGLPLSNSTNNPFFRIEIACAPNSNNVAYLVMSSPGGNGNGNGVFAGMFRTINGGATWQAITAPDDAQIPNPAPPTPNPGDFITQGNFCLSLAVHPTNSNTIFVGGLTLFRGTVNAPPSVTWSQISEDPSVTGTLNTAISDIHVDQHGTFFDPSNSNIMYFITDDGVYRTTNGNSTPPIISRISQNLNITQFFSCAMQPDANTFSFLGGAIDNGTRQFNGSAMSTTSLDVSNGDGAFCFIDQTLGSQRRLISSQNNRWLVSTDGGVNYAILNSVSTNGLFIPPADYDSANDRLYSSGNTNQLLRWNNLTPGTAPTTLTSTTINGGLISAIAVSPNNPNTHLYIGINNGRIIRVTNPNATTPTFTNITGTLPTTGNPYVSCITVGATDDELVITFSNYGMGSVWRTTNATATNPTWTPLDVIGSNLPDIPIRWALLMPANAPIGVVIQRLLVATDLGIWATNSLTSPNWYAINTGLGNVRTDMLKYRPSDGMLLAATTGRGMFRSDMLAAVAVDFRSLSPIVGLHCDFTLSSDNSVGATSWAWDIGNNGSVESIASTCFVYGGTTLDTPVKLTINGNLSIVKYLCDIMSVDGTPCLSHKTASSDATVSIFPNPTKNTFSLTLEESSVENRLISATIFDLLGRIVLETTDLTAIDISGQTEGMYIWQAKSSNGSTYKGRIVKQ